MKKRKKKNKIHYILGIQSYANHDSGASILKFDDYGKILDYVAISEERIVRRKYTYAFPINSINYCLEYFNLKDLKKIEYIFSDWIKTKNWLRSGPSYNYQEFDYLKEKLNFNKKNVVQIDHHLAHAATAYYASNYNEAAILIVDGLGSDNETNTYFVGKKHKIKLIEQYKHRGIGAVYAAVTSNILNLGFGGEGKTMGLAPYGKKSSKIIKYKFNGIKTNFSDFLTRHPHSDVLNQINENFRCEKIKVKYKKNVKKNFLNKYFSNIAYEVQDVAEKTFIHLGRDLYKKTKLKNICLAGGVALNSVANNKLLTKSKFKDMFVFPACSDAGIPFGLVLWGYYNFYKGKKKLDFQNAYTGKKYTYKDTKNLLKKINIKYTKTNNLNIAKYISEGSIVGRFSDRSEYGPRALGNRSILADPRSWKVRDYLNIHVKHRETFRPFAPAILEEESNKYFNIKYSPFMLQVAKVKKYKKIPSVCHVDKTARVQTVNFKQNKDFYDLIKKFKKITGIPCVLNTSFNDAGEPIVESPLDALITFLSTKIDYLILDKITIAKRDVKNTKKLLNTCKKIRQKNIENYRKLSLKRLIISYSKKELSKKSKIFNSLAKKEALDKPYHRMKNIVQYVQKCKELSFLIIGTNDHTNNLIKLFPELLRLSNIVYYEIRENDVINKRKVRFKLKKINKIKKKFDHLIISSFEYLPEIEEKYAKYSSSDIFTPYNNYCRNLQDYSFIKKYKGKIPMYSK